MKRPSRLPGSQGFGACQMQSQSRCSRQASLDLRHPSKRCLQWMHAQSILQMLYFAHLNNPSLHWV